MPTYVKILYAVGAFIIISAVSPVLGWSLKGLTNSQVTTSYTDSQGGTHTVRARDLDTQALGQDVLNGRISTQEGAYVKQKEPWWGLMISDDETAQKPKVRKGGFGQGKGCKSGGGAKFCSSGG